MLHEDTTIPHQHDCGDTQFCAYSEKIVKKGRNVLNFLPKDFFYLAQTDFGSIYKNCSLSLTRRNSCPAWGPRKLIASSQYHSGRGHPMQIIAFVRHIVPVKTVSYRSSAPARRAIRGAYPSLPALDVSGGLVHA